MVDGHGLSVIAKLKAKKQHSPFSSGHTLVKIDNLHQGVSIYSQSIFNSHSYLQIEDSHPNVTLHFGAL